MRFRSFLSIASVFILLLVGCSETESKTKSTKYVHIPPTMPDTIYDSLADGDFILRKGNGPLSFQIMNSTKEDYSHCGIIVKEDNKWRVIHAMGGGVSKDAIDGMQIMDLKDFVSYAADSILYICRAIFEDSLGPKIKDAAYGFLVQEVPFDHSFNIFSRDRIYCSELLFCVLKDVTGKNQFKIRKKHKSYLLLFETFFDEEKYQPIFNLQNMGD